MKTEWEKQQYNKAVNIVQHSRKTSIHYIMEQLQIGYVDAATLITEMETMGIISKPDYNDKRIVLIAET